MTSTGKESTGGESRHLSVRIDRTVDEVYAYASDPANLPAWALGLGSSVEKSGDRWIADSPMGRVEVAFAPRNALGVLDHDVTLPSGETVHNPVRVIVDGAGCEVVFTLRRQPGMGDAEFEHDAGTVAADLTRLKELMESGRDS
ncbi:SRPBCC family protein [Streptomyces sp. NPDC059142]|uniref:SRPBCC family protein n=1 Tax=Streptomyces sp. NPDC059142 TaxID=3346739 RepID=UPI00369D4F2D